MGRRKSYQRAHISHMRLDRMRCLVHKQTPPSVWQSLSSSFFRLFAISNPFTHSSTFLLPSTITYPAFLPSRLPTASTCATPFVSYPQRIHSLPLLGGGDINVSRNSSTLNLTIPNVDNTIRSHNSSFRHLQFRCQACLKLRTTHNARNRHQAR